MTSCLSCGRTIPRGPRCPPCRRTYEVEHYSQRKAKYTRAAGHPQHRAAWAPIVATGTVTCARYGTDPNCPGLIAPGTPWDLDHTDSGSRPSHQRCNRSAGGQSTTTMQTA